MSAAGFIVARSDLDPIMMATSKRSSLLFWLLFSLLVLSLMLALLQPDVCSIMHARPGDPADGAVGPPAGGCSRSLPAADTPSTRPPAVSKAVALAPGAGVEHARPRPVGRPRRRHVAVGAQAVDGVAAAHLARIAFGRQHHADRGARPRSAALPAGSRPWAAPTSQGTRSSSMRSSTAWVSGSPNRQFHSITIGPPAVNISPP